jgi:probable F420-dependent oxidoreductase
VRFGISIPQHVVHGIPSGDSNGDSNSDSNGGFQPDQLRDHLNRAEALGFDSAWTLELVLGSMPTLGAIETMSFAAACTERMRLGCAVFVTPLRNPVQLAKSLSTLDQLSGGRLDVGIGTGGRGRMFSAFDADPDTFVARFTEGLALMRALWTEPEITFDGRFWQLERAAMEPKPVQKPGPPIWFGGSHPAALRRAVRLGDGFFGAGSQTTAKFAEQVRVVREALASVGTMMSRDPASFAIAKRVYITVDDDAERARQRTASALHQMYAFLDHEDLAAVAVHGSPEACVEGLRAVADAGAELILLNPLFDDAEQMERLAADVIPHLA